jgi:2-hydroxychromene-2-carboxylate isomerase
MQPDGSFRFYFSFRSPFAAIAFYRLRRSIQFSRCDIELIPVWPENIFGGHMDNPTDNLFKIAYIFWDAARQAEEAGLPSDYFRSIALNFTLPTDVDYTKKKRGLEMPKENWALTHHGFNYAKENGKGWAFGDAVFRKRFNFDGSGPADVMDPEVLKDIARQVGLDPEELADAAGSGRYATRQEEYVNQSEKDGVFGVPFFAIDQADRTEVFWGNDRLAFLLKTLAAEDSMPTIPPFSVDDVQASRV